MECLRIQRQIWTGETGEPRVAAHLATCGECEMEARRSSQLLGTLTQLRHDLASTPPDLHPAIVAAVFRPSTVQRTVEVVTHPTFLRGAAVGATAAAVAAFGLAAARRFARPDFAG